MNSSLKRVIVVSILASLMLSLLIISPDHQAFAKELKLNKTKLSLSVGDTYKLKVKDANGIVKWSSSDKTVAKVSKKGKVTAMGKGSAVITAKVSGKKLKCKVTVSAGTKIADGNYFTNPMVKASIKNNVLTIKGQLGHRDSSYNRVWDYAEGTYKINLAKSFKIQQYIAEDVVNMKQSEFNKMYKDGCGFDFALYIENGLATLIIISS